MIKRLKIVLDTNALISILSRRLNFHSILISLKDDNFDLFITNEILLEYEEKIIRFYGEKQLTSIIYLFELLQNVHKISTYFNMSLIKTDESDNKFVDCAFACNADYIVTNDKHFNILKNIEYPKINTISIEEFSELLKTYK